MTRCCPGSPSGRPPTRRRSQSDSPDVADVQFIRPARNREDVEEIVKEYGARGLDGIAIVMLTYGPAMRTVRALVGDPAAAAAREHPARARGHGRLGHGRPHLQPGHPWRPGPGERARARGRVPFSVITGEWDSDGFAADFADWARAAATVTALRSTRIALFGYPMNGMGDILYDPPAMLRRLGPAVSPRTSVASTAAWRASATTASVSSSQSTAAGSRSTPRCHTPRTSTPFATSSPCGTCSRRRATPGSRRTSTRSEATVASSSCRCWPRPT